MLSDEGEVLLNLRPEYPLNDARIRLKSIRRFLEGRRRPPIYGDNPRTPGKKEVFSVASIQSKVGVRYIYVVLNNRFFGGDWPISRLRWLLSSTMIFLVLSFLVTGAIGALLFSGLTRRLNVLAASVDSFAEGNRVELVPVGSSDEIGRLARAFNSMAETITANVRALEFSDQHRRKFIANIVHDLRGPLTSIYGFSETLVTRGDSIKEKKVRAKIESAIHRNVCILKRLIEDLFELSKLETPEQSLQVGAHNLEDLFEDLRLKYELNLEDDNLFLKISVDENLPAVAIDPNLLERALSNLLENAFRSALPGTTVYLTASSSEKGVRVTVRDEGSGISAEDLPYVFERFFSGDRGRMKKDERSGLGLAIVKQIMDLHGVEVKVWSEVQRGTCFEFVLPVAF